MQYSRLKWIGFLGSWQAHNPELNGMDEGKRREILKLMRAAQAQRRGYADFFHWPLDRDLEERGLVQSLSEALESRGELFFHSVRSRGRPNDPPDCEALDGNGERIGIEVTELVDEAAIVAFRAGAIYEWAEWGADRFVRSMAERLIAKAGRYAKLKDSPYPGGYVVVLHTDEPNLNHEQVNRWLRDAPPFDAPNVSRAFLLLSYEPRVRGYPYFEIQLRR